MVARKVNTHAPSAPADLASPASEFTHQQTRIDRLTQAWVRTTGRAINEPDHPWLHRPNADARGIGQAFFARWARECNLRIVDTPDAGLTRVFGNHVIKLYRQHLATIRYRLTPTPTPTPTQPHRAALRSRARSPKQG